MLNVFCIENRDSDFLSGKGFPRWIDPIRFRMNVKSISQNANPSTSEIEKIRKLSIKDILENWGEDEYIAREEIFYLII